MSGMGERGPIDDAWKRCEAALAGGESVTLAKCDPTAPPPRVAGRQLPYRAALYRYGTFAYASNAPTPEGALSRLAEVLEARRQAGE